MTTARFDGAREVPSVTSNGVRCVTEKVVAVGPRTLFGGSVVTDAREIIAQTLGHHPGWSRTADAILAALTAAGFRIVGPDDDKDARIAALEAQLAAVKEALEEIQGKGRALRQGGPDPMDLTDLSDALQDAADLAGQALSILDGAALAVTEREAKEGR